MHVSNRYSQTRLDHPATSKVTSPSSSKTLGIWLFTVAAFIAVLVVFGGFVRLTRSGLSIVEWNVVTGVIPPVGEVAWQETFEKYQRTPEYQKINTGMTLAEYKFIYYMEYFHRLLGRLGGLLLVIPLFIFLAKGIIPRRKAPLYLGLALLFGLQGAVGWYMVQSGLVDQPHVSHYRLTAHLLLALLLFAGCLWLGFENTVKPAPQGIPAKPLLSKLAGGLLITIIIQIAYGGFVAGLKAGQVSNTFPLMGGALIPAELMWWLDPWAVNLIANSVTVHFIHRWFAFIVLALAIALYYTARRQAAPAVIQMSSLALAAVVSVQVLLGVGVILWGVPLSVALIHQATALLVFAVALFIVYRLFVSREPAG